MGLLICSKGIKLLTTRHITEYKRFVNNWYADAVFFDCFKELFDFSTTSTNNLFGFLKSTFDSFTACIEGFLSSINSGFDVSAGLGQSTTSGLDVSTIRVDPLYASLNRTNCSINALAGGIQALTSSIEVANSVVKCSKRRLDKPTGFIETTTSCFQSYTTFFDTLSSGFHPTTALIQGSEPSVDVSIKTGRQIFHLRLVGIEFFQTSVDIVTSHLDLLLSSLDRIKVCLGFCTDIFTDGFDLVLSTVDFLNVRLSHFLSSVQFFYGLLQ